jgi:Uncharacterised nucleotidyltransferase
MGWAVNAVASLARALADPSSVLALDAEGWTALLTVAKAERLAGTLAHRIEGLNVPEDAAHILANARANAEVGRTQALWEIEMCARALAPLGVPVVLLKGSAFVAAGLAAGQGRLIGDLDILVPRDRLDAVEQVLLEAGWEWVKPDPYDDAYYRRWMHELPPLIHRARDRMIDVHHTILPLTARPRPDAAGLIANRSQLSGQLCVLSPQDMIVHGSAHLFADGDMAGGLRNLWDIHCLISDFGADALFWPELEASASRHGLAVSVHRALRLSKALFATAIPEPLDRWNRKDTWYLKRLTARDGWGRETRPFIRFVFYVRSHWLRMPPLMLMRHLWIKWRKGAQASG